MAGSHGGARKGSGRPPLSPDEKAKKHQEYLAARREKAKERLAAKSPHRPTPQPKAKPKRPAPPRKPGEHIQPHPLTGFGVDQLRELLELSQKYGRGKRRSAPDVSPFKIIADLHPPQALPPASMMAMDTAVVSSGEWATAAWASAAVFGSMTEGMTFLGFPILAEMSLRPEFRTISEIIGTECTRKWIKFNSTTGTKQGSNNDGEETDEPAADEEIKTTPPEQGGNGPPEEDDKSDKIRELEDFLDELMVRDRYRDIIVQDGFFGRSHLAHLFNDQNVGPSADPAANAELKTPIGNGRDDVSQSKITKGTKMRLQTVEAVWTYPLAYNASNPLAPDFYNPQQWYVLGTEIHSSRLLTFVGRPVPDLLKPTFSFGGLSMTQIAKPYVDIWLQTREAVAALIHSFSVMVLKTDLATMTAPGGAAMALARATLFNTMRDNMSLMMVNKATEDFANVSVSLAGLHELQAQAQEHMFCCRSGTLVETDRGQVPIEKVTLEDRVMTRDGLAPVRWAGQTGTASELVEIRTGDSVLGVTGWHPIWSETTREFVNAENVDHSHRLLRSTSWGSTAHRLSGAVAGGGTPSKGITGIKRLAAFFIAKSMKLTSDLSPMVSTFITSMTTRLTTALPTSNFLLAPITTDGTSPRSVASTSIDSGRRQNSVWSAATPSRLSCTNAQSIAPVPAKPRSGNPVEIASVRTIEGPSEPVYNIEVAEGFLPEFYANGILVHNSVSRIPAVKFAGIQPAGLNASSEGEIRVFYDTIAAYQQAFIRPNLTRTIDFAMLCLWGEVDNDITFEFEQLWELNEKEKAEARKMDAETASIHINDGVISPEEERKRLASDPDGAYQGIDPTDVPEPPPEPPMGEEGGDPFGGESDATKPTPPNEDKERGGASDAALPFVADALFNNPDLDTQNWIDSTRRSRPAEIRVTIENPRTRQVWRLGHQGESEGEGEGEGGEGGGGDSIGGDEFAETEHPRAPDGKFGAGGKGATSEPNPPADFVAKIKTYATEAQEFVKGKSAIEVISAVANNHRLQNDAKDALSLGIQSFLTHAAGLDASNWKNIESVVDHVIHDFGTIKSLTVAKSKLAMADMVRGLIAVRQKAAGAQAHDEGEDGVVSLLYILLNALEKDDDGEQKEAPEVK